LSHTVIHLQDRKQNPDMLDKIQSYFGFSTMPFARNLAPGKLFRSADHAQAVARIGYGITTRGITVITGEVGVGKTVAARAAIDRAEPARHHLIYIPDPTVGARGVYHHIVAALGGRPSFHNAALVPQARDALAAEHAERGRVPILCIDEGHLLTHDALEALRLLTNHRLDTESPFATILLGQPTLATKMALGILAALEQRITVRRTMTGMTSDETAGYVRHHLQLAGRSDPLFTDDATALIHNSGRGKPRAVNRLAIAALIAACTAGKNLVDDASARSAITETNHDTQPATP
jgi:type II secretory pathway predicted ATPase ExeA